MSILLRNCFFTASFKVHVEKVNVEKKYSQKGKKKYIIDPICASSLHRAVNFLFLIFFSQVHIGWNINAKLDQNVYGHQGARSICGSPFF